MAVEAEVVLLEGQIPRRRAQHLIVGRHRSPGSSTGRARNAITTIEHRVADWTAWEHDARYDLVLGADILYGDAVHGHLRHIFDRNLAPGGEVLLSDPFRTTSFALLEAMEAEGWIVTMNKWTVGVTPPPRPVGVFSLRPTP